MTPLSDQCSHPKIRLSAKNTRIIIRLLPTKRRWSLFNLESKQSCEIESDKLSLHGTNIKINQKRFSNKIILSPQGLGFNVIAELDIEKYLVGVLTKEMPSQFPLEAFKAQAIASRSYALKKILSSKTKSYDLESSVTDQMFEFSKGTEKIKSAIFETKNTVLENDKGQLFSVYYHANCGGRTEEPSDVWGNGEKIGSVKDEACPNEGHSHWNFNISKFELTARLRVILQLGDAQIVSIEEFENTNSGRKKSLQFILDDHSVRIISGQQLRNILGFDRLKSTMFAFNERGDHFVFEGQGHGHGVGMCQWGARHLALSGESFKRILIHYFPQARLAQISKTLLN